MPAFPARLHAVFASKAPYAVIFRRGLAGAVCTIGWDREYDRFELGQWLRGRIFERRADLSPDGRHLIYCARGGRRHAAETKGTWTAISRAPWLHAIVLLGKAIAGRAAASGHRDRTYWVNGRHFPVRDSREVREDVKFRPAAAYGGECTGVYYLRLQRDG